MLVQSKCGDSRFKSGLWKEVKKKMLKQAIESTDVCIQSIRELGESKKTNAMIGKLLSIKAELTSQSVKQEIMDAAPGKRKKKGEL